MDFYTIKETSTKQGVLEIFPDFKVRRSNDLMIRGMGFYAIWDEEQRIWSTDEYDVQRLVDLDLWKHKESIAAKHVGNIRVKDMTSYSSKSWSMFKTYLKNMPDNYKMLDEELTFANQEVKKKDYVSKRLPYSLEQGTIEAYDEVMGTLYNPEEREKIEWAIGSIIAGDSKHIQKFIVLYGKPGVGKGTVINIVEKLFEGYYTTFDAKALAGNNNSFATDVFKDNPLVAIQHDGDLSRIEDNAKLNSIVSHELMSMNEKFKPSYTARVNSFLFMGTNKPVKISDSKSGIIRRLIDVNPIGVQIPSKRYHTLVSQIDFELGAIAYHCLEVYRKLGKNYYQGYRPIDMMYQTDTFFNFVEQNYFIFKDAEGVTLSQAWTMYNEYCEDSGIEKGKGRLQRHIFKSELQEYFLEFSDVTRIDGKQIRSYYQKFNTAKFTNKNFQNADEKPLPLVLEETTSIFDEMYADSPAQYADNDVPGTIWKKVKSKLSDIDTSKTHYVRPPENHIVIDFDIVNEHGEKDMLKNLEAASKFPPTYAEFSNGGKGVHLHYIYDGDTSQLSRVYDDEIEVKIFTGMASLRRRVSKANNTPIATISSGLPIKEKKMINAESVQSEIGLRKIILRNLNKEIHPGTKSSVDFIHKILEDAFDSGIAYDVSDMKQQVLIFAMNSTNQATAAVKKVSDMKWASLVESDPIQHDSDQPIVFYDIEVFPNLLLVVWKKPGGNFVRMINPTATEISEFIKMKLIGFNCRRYDNHILYGRFLGYNNKQIYQLSKAIINNDKNALFREAYSLSYTDIYDYATKKQSLKKWELDLGITHKELEIPWDEPIPDNLLEEVITYCENDVAATEATFNATQADWAARLILSDASGLTPNDSTQNHAKKLLFGNDKNHKDQFVYTDLSKEFPGYKYDYGKSTYRGLNPSEGGYVYSMPGVWNNVAVLDVMSMHPTTAIVLNIFGKYTKNFKDIYDARQAINQGRWEDIKGMLNGVLVKYIKEDDPQTMSELSYALKIVINILYGMTSASFDNAFKDPNNIDNIVAKRGALMMIDLQYAVIEKGWNPIHIKTDSIKIDNVTKEKIEFVVNFGKKYGYTFVHETTFSKIALVNDAVYIGKIDWDVKEKKIGTWEAVGAQFKHPYVYKYLFSKEPIEFEDLKEDKGVKTTMYLDMNEGLIPEEEALEYKKLTTSVNKLIKSGIPENDKEVISIMDRIDELDDKHHDYIFVGKVGSFVPILPGLGGGLLVRKANDKYHAVTGTKGYRWMESTMVQELGKEKDVDYSYYRKLVDAAVDNISNYGDIESFLD